MEENKCTQCGTPVVAGAALCANCANAAAQAQQAPPAYQQPVPPAAPAPVAGAGNSKLYSILAYFGILFLIGMFAAPEKDDPKVKFHVGQGMTLAIAWIGGGIVISILSAIVGAVTSGFIGWFLGFVFGILSFVVWVGGIALAIMGALSASKGEEKTLPVIGKYVFYK